MDLSPKFKAISSKNVTHNLNECYSFEEQIEINIRKATEPQISDSKKFKFNKSKTKNFVKGSVNIDLELISEYSPKNNENDFDNNFMSEKSINISQSSYSFNEIMASLKKGINEIEQLSNNESYAKINRNCSETLIFNSSHFLKIENLSSSFSETKIITSYIKNKRESRNYLKKQSNKMNYKKKSVGIVCSNEFSIKSAYSSENDSDQDTNTIITNLNNFLKRTLQNNNKKNEDKIDIEKINAITLDDFETIEIISQGGFGRVYLAKKKTTNDYFAIKK